MPPKKGLPLVANLALAVLSPILLFGYSWPTNLRYAHIFISQPGGLGVKGGLVVVILSMLCFLLVVAFVAGVLGIFRGRR